MPEALIPVVVAAVTLALFCGGILFALRRFYRPIPTGKALIVSTPQGKRVCYDGAVVFPFIQHAEMIDLTAKTIRIERRKHEAVLTSDDVRAEVDATFLLRVNRTAEDILKAADHVGCPRTADVDALAALFAPRFISTIQTVVRHFTYAQLTSKRDELEDKIILVLGQDLNGYMVENLAIDRVEEAPAETSGPFR